MNHATVDLSREIKNVVRIGKLPGVVRRRLDHEACLKDGSDQPGVPKISDILAGNVGNNVMKFEGGGEARVNEDYSVTFTEDEIITTISGFPSKKEAIDFCMFGDFDKAGNDYVLIVKPNFKLTWNRNSDKNKNKNIL